MAMSEHEIEAAALELIATEDAADLQRRATRFREATEAGLNDLVRVGKGVEALRQAWEAAEACVADAKAKEHAAFRRGVDFMMEHGPDGGAEMSPDFIRGMAARATEHSAARAEVAGAVRVREHAEAKVVDLGERAIETTAAHLDRIPELAAEFQAIVEGMERVARLRVRIAELRADGKGAA